MLVLLGIFFFLFRAVFAIAVNLIERALVHRVTLALSLEFHATSLSN